MAIDVTRRFLKRDGAGFPVPQYYDPDAADFVVVEGVGGLLVGGHTVAASAAFARPNDTTPYTAGDCVSNSAVATVPLELALGRISGGSGYLVKLRLVTNQVTCTASFRVWLYTTATPTVGVDNAPFTLLWANRASRVGYVDLAPLASAGAGSDSAAVFISTQLPFVCSGDTGSLFAVLETKSAFTPAAGQQFFLEALAEVN